MSTATLLILSARLRGHRRNARRPAAWPAREKRAGRVGGAARLLAMLAGLRRVGRPGSGPSLQDPSGRAWRQTGADAPQPFQRFRAGLLAVALTVPAGQAVLAQAAPRQAGQDAPSQADGADIVLPAARVAADHPTQDHAASDGAERAEGMIGGRPVPQAPCVMVDIAGHKAGHLDCASQKLEAAGRGAQAQARAAIETPVIDARSADVRTGVAHQTATRQRMGNTFGTSVHPQRPYRAPPAPRPGGGRP